MNRFEQAERYMNKCAELGSFNLKRMNAQNDGLQFVAYYLYRSRDRIVYPGDIAKASGVSTARVAAALNRLEEKAIIQRAPAEEDSRKTVVKLTEQGVRFVEERAKEVIQCTANVIDIVGVEDMDEFLRIANKIKRALETLDKKGNENV